MSWTEQMVTLTLRKKLLSILTKSFVDKQAQTIRTYVKKLIINRIVNDKVDLYGRKFGKYNQGVYMWGPKGRFRNKIQAQKYAAQRHGMTQYASTSLSDPLRLTGNLLSNIQVPYIGSTISGTRVEIKFKITVPDNLKPQVEGLQSNQGVARNGKGYSKKSWTFLGLSENLGETMKVKNLAVNLFRNEIKDALIKTKNL